MKTLRRRTFPKVEWWKKPPLDQATVDNFREILHLTDEDELPEPLYLTIGLHMAINRYLVPSEMEYSDCVRLVLQAASFHVNVDQNWVKPGSVITIRSQQKTAIYICRGAFDLDLVNRYGMWLLVPPEDIEASQEAQVDSEFNRNAELGKRFALSEIGSAGLDKLELPQPSFDELEISAADLEELR